MQFELLPTRRRTLLDELAPEGNYMVSDPRYWGGEGYDAPELTYTTKPAAAPVQPAPPSMAAEDPMWPTPAAPYPGRGLRPFPPQPYMNPATMFASQQDRTPSGALIGPGPVTRKQRYQNTGLPGYEDLGFKGEGDGLDGVDVPVQSRDDESAMAARGELPRGATLADVLGPSVAATDPTLSSSAAVAQHNRGQYPGSPFPTQANSSAGPGWPSWAADALDAAKRAPQPGQAAEIIAKLDAEKAAKMQQMQTAMGQRGNAMMGAIQPGMDMAESGAASTAALQAKIAEQKIAGGTPWWKAQGDQTTFYSGNKPSTSNEEWLAQFGGGINRSGRGPGGGAYEQSMPAPKPLTLIDALAPGESNQVKDHMGRVQWAKNDAALPRSPDEPKWSPGMTPVNGPNSPAAMARYEQAMQLQRERQAARGFDPNKNNGSQTGLAEARAMVRSGMDPTVAMATARENKGNPIAPNSLLGGALMGPELLQEYARGESLVRTAEVRAKEFATQAELARQQGDMQHAERMQEQANRAAAEANRFQLGMKQIEAQMAQSNALIAQQAESNKTLNDLRTRQDQRDEKRFDREMQAPLPGSPEAVKRDSDTDRAQFEAARQSPNYDPIGNPQHQAQESVAIQNGLAPTKALEDDLYMDLAGDTYDDNEYFGDVGDIDAATWEAHVKKKYPGISSAAARVLLNRLVTRLNAEKGQSYAID